MAGSNLLTVLVPMFASNTVTVYREEEAYSLLSLVSDCGGLLGLFIQGHSVRTFSVRGLKIRYF